MNANLKPSEKLLRKNSFRILSLTVSLIVLLAGKSFGQKPIYNVDTFSFRGVLVINEFDEHAYLVSDSLLDLKSIHSAKKMTRVLAKSATLITMPYDFERMNITTTFQSLKDVGINWPGFLKVSSYYQREWDKSYHLLIKKKDKRCFMFSVDCTVGMLLVRMDNLAASKFNNVSRKGDFPQYQVMYFIADVKDNK